MTLPSQPEHNPAGRQDTLQGRLTGLHGNLLAGWVRDRQQPQRRWIVAVHGDGQLLGLAQAEQFHPEAPGDGSHGFQLMLSDAQLDATRTLTLTLANDDTPLDSLTLPADEPARHTPQSSRVVWQPGLVLRGWLVDPASPQRRLSVEAREGERLVARATPDSWIVSANAYVEGGFQLRLPLSLADGHRHELIVTDSDGRELAGSPVIVQEWPQGLGQWLTTGQGDRPEAHELITRQLARYEQLLPRGVDMADYSGWAQAFAPQVPSAEMSAGTIGVLQLGEGELVLNTGDALNVRRWTLTAPGDAAAYRQALADACRDCDAIVQLEPGDRLPEGALERAWQTLQTHRAALVYSDFDAPLADDATARRGGFLPAWDPDRHWCQDYLAAGLCLVRSDVLRDHPHPPASPQEFSYAACEGAAERAACEGAACEGAALERLDAGQILHLPLVLRHRAHPWAESGETSASPSATDAELLARLNTRLARQDALATLEPHPERPGLRRLVRHLTQWPTVTLIIPTRDALPLLRRCVDTLLAHTDYPGHVRLLIVDNQSREAQTLAYFDELQRRGTQPLGKQGQRQGQGQGTCTVDVLAYPHPFNYAAINNAAVAHLNATARDDSDVIGLVNNDIEAQHGDWLCRMVALLMRDDTGAVGAKLLWPNGMVQHGGVIGGVHGLAAHVGNAWQAEDSGYLGMNHVTQRFSAVTAACLLMRRADYRAVGGLDARDFPVGFNDVDLCLKLRARGQAVVWTPEARLIHAESATRGKDESAEKAARAQREMANLRRRWGNALSADPAYNPNLSLDTASDPYTSLALPPRARRVRTHELPRQSLQPDAE